MDKISQQDLSQLLHDAASELRKTSTERDLYKDKCASMERRQQAEKLAGVMHAKGLELDVSAIDLADRLEKAAQDGKFETIAQAVDYIGPDMSAKIGQLASDEARHAPGSDLERYLVGGLG